MRRAYSIRVPVFLLSLTWVLGTSCHTGPVNKIAVRLTLAGSPATMAYLPHTLAQQLGFYDGHGLAVTTEAVSGGTKGVQALLGGSADVVAGYYDHTIRMAAQGQAIQSFVTLTQYPGNTVVISPVTHKTIRQITDLRGATVGVPDLGSQSHLVLNYLLVKNGLTPGDITAVSIGSQSAAVAALEHGKIDAWSGFDPGATQVLKRHPTAKLLADARTSEGVREMFGIDQYPGSVMYAKPDWLQHNAEAARRMAQAIQQSLDWISKHTPEEIVAKLPTEFVGGDRAVYLEALTKAMPMYSKDGVMPAEAPEVTRKVVSASLENVRSAQMDVKKTYTNEYLSK